MCLRSGVSAALAKRQSCARIIMYHEILSRDLLACQLKYFRRHFRIISLDHLVKQLALGKPVQDQLVLTFDDGLRNNLTVAYPILEQLGLPATFFVCPGLINTGAWLWTNEVRCRLHTLHPEALLVLLPELACPPTNLEGAVEWMKTLGLAERKLVEQKIRNATPLFRPTAQEHEAFDTMDWDDLRSLDPGLITIGSHTLTHAILPTLTEYEIESEIVESRRQLEQELGRPVGYFCYPNGSHHPQSWVAARRTYDAAVTTRIGMLTPENARDLHCLPRIPATKHGALMAWRLHRPEA